MKKKCVGCEKELDLESFYQRRPGVYYRKCKACKWAVTKARLDASPADKKKISEYQKAWYSENKERVAQLRKEVRKESGANKWSYIWYTYRMRESTYAKLFREQKGVCAICLSDKKLYIDHDHSCCPDVPTCGACVRGLVCQKCNMFMHYVDEYDFFERAKAHSTSRVFNPDSRVK